MKEKSPIVRRQRVRQRGKVHLYSEIALRFPTFREGHFHPLIEALEAIPSQARAEFVQEKIMQEDLLTQFKQAIREMLDTGMITVSEQEETTETQQRGNAALLALLLGE